MDSFCGGKAGFIISRLAIGFREEVYLNFGR